MTRYRSSAVAPTPSGDFDGSWHIYGLFTPENGHECSLRAPDTPPHRHTLANSRFSQTGDGPSTTRTKCASHSTSTTFTLPSPASPQVSMTPGPKTLARSPSRPAADWLPPCPRGSSRDRPSALDRRPYSCSSSVDSRDETTQPPEDRVLSVCTAMDSNHTNYIGAWRLQWTHGILQSTFPCIHLFLARSYLFQSK